jgi:hypothetical protein
VASPGFLLGGSGGTSISGGALVYTGLDSQASNANEEKVQSIFPMTQTFTKFYCSGPKPTGGTSDVFTVRIGGVSQSGTCTILTGGTGIAKETVNITLNPEQLVDVQVKMGNEAGAVSWSLAP